MSPHSSQAQSPAPQAPTPTSAPIQPPSVRRPPPANRPPGSRPISGRAKREPKLLRPDLPSTCAPGFWRAAFLRTLGDRQAGQRLYAKARDPAEGMFLWAALESQTEKLRRDLNYWLDGIGGLTGTGEAAS